MFMREKIHLFREKNHYIWIVLFLVCLGIFLFAAIKIGHKLYSVNKENREYENMSKAKQNMDPEKAVPEPFEKQPGSLPAEALPSFLHTEKQPGSLPTEALPNSLTFEKQPGSLPAEALPNSLPTEKQPSSLPVEELPLLLPYEVITEPSSFLNANGILKMYEANWEVNHDMIGWILMPGYENNIDYPVMQSTDNSFYLTKDFYKNKAYCGSIFMDATNQADVVDRNIVIYGHAMRALSMFGNLMDFPDIEEEYRNNTTIYLDLLNTRLEYEVFSTYYAQTAYNYRQTEFTDDKDYQNFLDRISSKSFYDYNIFPSTQDKILTLSTCNSYSGKDDRTVIHARLIRQTLFTGTQEQTSSETSQEPSDKDIVSANMYLNKLELQYSQENPGLVFEKAAFDIPFITGYTYYYTVLPSNAEACKLIIEVDDPAAFIEMILDGEQAEPRSFIIPKGIHIIKVMVVSQDRKYTRTYSISVTKK